MSGWYRYDPRERRLTLTVHVQPGASATGAAGLHGDALKIRIAAPATENRANKALLDFLIDLLQVRGAQIRIRQGVRARRKIVEVADVDVSVLERLDAAAQRRNV